MKGENYLNLNKQAENIVKSHNHLSFLGKWKTTSVLKANGRESKFLGKLKMTSLLDKWKTTLIFQADARLSQVKP